MTARRADLALALLFLVGLAAGCPSPSSSAGVDCGRVEAARCPPCPLCDGGGVSPGAAGDAGAEIAACANLARLGCSEGVDPACAFEVQRAEADRLTVVPLACLARASSPAAARACGFVKCLGDGGQ